MTLAQLKRKFVAVLPQAGGTALVVFAAIALEASKSLGLQIPNPPAILLLLVVYSAFRGGHVPGLVSALLALTYIGWFFSIEGKPFSYSEENLVRVLVWVVCVPLMVWMIGRLKQQLVGHAERYLQALEAAPTGMLMVDQQGQIALLNAQIERLFGYTRADLIGQSVELLVPERSRAAHPANRSGFFADARARPMGAGRDLHGRRKDGSEFPVEVGLNSVSAAGRSMVLCSVVDITERKRAEDMLRASEARTRLLLDSSGEGIYGVDMDGNCTFCNPACVRLAGHADPAALLGRNMHQVLHHSRADGSPYPVAECRLYRAYREGVEVRVDDEVFWRADGTSFPVEYLSCPIRAGGEVTGVVVLFADITERRRAAAVLAHANEELTRASAMKSQFLATMSHELRTPLNSIIGFTGIILQRLAGPLNPEQAKQLGMVQDAARHLLELINDVLDISKIEAGELEVAREPFDLRASIAKVLGMVAPLAEKKGLALETRLAPELGEAVGDARRVEQVLLNLLNNAIKFTPQGHVALDAAPSGDDVVLCVTDTGIGISPEDMGNLFQMFRQVDAGLARNHEGTGLGLAISQRLATLMGGRIHAESQWGKGSTFTFTLPLKGPVAA